ncbi:hypothetical protein ABEX25_00005 [Paenibacillus thiaminolyticus]|uniref:hypothetical protein n=1 Tax=Paenibacillus thiaminolyticus TaxID=49283 RepID=UPI003D2BF1B3
MLLDYAAARWASAMRVGEDIRMGRVACAWGKGIRIRRMAGVWGKGIRIRRMAGAWGKGIRIRRMAGAWGKGEAQSLQKWRYCATLELEREFPAIQIVPQSCEKQNSCKNASISPYYGTYPVYIPKKMYFRSNSHEILYFGG